MSSISRRLGALGALVVLASVPLGLPAAAFVDDQAKQPTDATAKTGDKAGKAGKKASEKSEGVAPGTLKGGKVTQRGWWSRSNQQAPETGLLAPPSLPMVAAPAGSYPVAALAGDAERITALEFSLNGATGSVVKSVLLSLRESADPTGSPNAGSASIVACPMTELTWIEAQNGPWVNKPDYDCALASVPGTRDEEGVWSFDLTPLAFSWLAEDREFAPAVVLVSTPADEGAEPQAGAEQSASSFQVAFDTDEGLGLIAKTGKASNNSGGSGSSGGGSTPVDPGTDDGGGVTDAGGGGFGGGDLGDSGGDLGAPIDPIEPAELDGTNTTAAAGNTPPQTSVAPVSAIPLPWHADIGAKALLAVPALLIAYLVMIAMGPTGQPVVGGGRRGVSRALDRVTSATPLRFGKKFS